MVTDGDGERPPELGARSRLHAAACGSHGGGSLSVGETLCWALVFRFSHGGFRKWGNYPQNGGFIRENPGYPNFRNPHIVLF